MTSITQKYYQTQLLKLSTQNSLLQSEILQLKVNHQELIKQLSDTRLTLAETQHKFNDVKNLNTVNENNYRNTKQKYLEAQNSYKTLYDYIFLNVGHLQKSFCQHCKRIQRSTISSQIEFTNSLNKINYNFQKQRIQKLQDKLKTKDLSIKNLLQQNSKLKADIINLTSEYYRKLSKINGQKRSIEYELKIFKQKKQNIQKRLQQQSNETNYFSQNVALQIQVNNLKFQNKNLIQQLNISNQKVKLLQSNKANNENDKKQELTEINKNKEVTKTQSIPNIQQICQIMKKNQTLIQENQQLQGRLNLIEQQFPDLFQNISQIQNFTKKYKKFTSLQRNYNQLAQDKKDALQTIELLKKSAENLRSQNAQLSVKRWKKYQQSLIYIVKIKEVIRRVDPYFDNYSYNTTNVFTQQEIQKLQQEFDFEIQKQQNLKSSNIKLQLDNKKVKEQLQIANRQIETKTALLQKNKQQLFKNRAIIESGILQVIKKRSQINFINQQDNENIMENQDQKSYSFQNKISKVNPIQIYKRTIQELQNERQDYSRLLIQKQRQMTQIRAERDFYKLNRNQQTIIINQVPSLRTIQTRGINIVIQQQSQNFNNVQEKIIILKKQFQQNAKKSIKDLDIIMRENQAAILKQRQIINQYINQIKQLNQKIKFYQTKRNSSQQVSQHKQKNKNNQRQPNHIQANYQNQRIINQGQQNQQNRNQSLNNQDILPSNSINQQSINYFKKLLENHEILLRKTLLDYQNLQKNYKASIIKISQIQESGVHNIKQKLIQRQKQLKNNIIQSKEAANNINNLEYELNKSQQQILEIQKAFENQKNQHEIDIKNKDETIKQLEKSLQQVKSSIQENIRQRHNAMQDENEKQHQKNAQIKLSINDPAISSLMIMISSKKDQILELKKNNDAKQNRIRQLEEQLEKKQRRQIMGINEKSPLDRQQYIEVFKILSDGKLITAMGDILEYLRGLKDKRQKQVQNN